MESLISLADALDPLKTRAKSRRVSLKRKHAPNIPTTAPTIPTDPTLSSISKRTALPKSLRSSSPLLEEAKKYGHIADSKLRTRLVRQAAHKEQTKALLKDAELLLNNQAGGMEVEGEMEKTWKMSQNEIVQAAGQEAARGRRELKLDGGPYRSRFTKNGR
jgi:U3 small nucleolar RNA-associated protein 7